MIEMEQWLPSNSPTLQIWIPWKYIMFGERHTKLFWNLHLKPLENSFWIRSHTREWRRHRTIFCMSN